MSNEIFAQLIEGLGTFAFAISGVRLAASKKYDIFGALIVGFATAVGGGTLRDLLLGAPVFWLVAPRYLILTFVAMLFYIFFRRSVVRWGEAIMLFDTLGLAFFNMTGIKVALGLEASMFAAIIMGTITGTAGGVIRDVLIQEPPLIFQKKEIYAVACLLGGAVYAIGFYAQVNDILLQVVTISVVVAVRILSRMKNLTLPYAG
ncbi:MAG: trimeric intracellular cation channel family protein [Lentisphaerae bacterium]|jgi:uncharacterized membrane protein YeiH|nr:trimeric intracellular cation channel family protein [Lentisphaerota bacterium]